MGTKAPLLPLQVENESNVLQDGSLIDLCGATLLWRTPAGLLRAPKLKHPWYLIFLKRSLVFPILLFSSISLH